MGIPGVEPRSSETALAVLNLSRPLLGFQYFVLESSPYPYFPNPKEIQNWALGRKAQVQLGFARGSFIFSATSGSFCFFQQRNTRLVTHIYC